jgi:hypothetical protein
MGKSPTATPSRAENEAAKAKKEQALKKLHDRLQNSFSEKADRKQGLEYWTEFGMPLRITDKISGETHLAERGEMPGDDEDMHPYSMWSTAAFNSHGGDFKEFGIGLGLYFKSEIVFGCLLFVMMFITAPTINYYGSMAYSNEQNGTDIVMGEVGGLNSGTAACTKQIFVWMNHKYGPSGSFGMGESVPRTLPTYNQYWDEMGGTVRNTCLLTKEQGYLDLFAALLFITFVIAFGRFVDHQIEEMDESVQTAQDYSIVVTDPPGDAKGCDEWKEYFSQFGVVASVTIAIDNADITMALGREKYLRRQKKLEKLYDQDSELAEVDDDETAEALVACCRATVVCSFMGDLLQTMGIGRDEVWCDKELAKNKIALDEALMLEHDHDAKQVFVIFDTEKGQRRCLSELRVGDIPAALDNAPARWGAQGASYKFRKQHILHVEEAQEPSEIQWQNLGASPKVLMIQQIVTFLITLFLVVIAALVVKAGTYPAIMAILIALFNGALPEILKIVNSLEKHDVFNDAQQSLLMKLLMARIVMSSFVLTFIVIDYELTLTNQAMSSITGVMLAEAVTTPIIHFADFSTLGKQIVFGPFMKTQAAMNMLWEGSVWTLSERYTDLVKAMFTALFFMSIVPIGLLFSCLAMFVCYWVDKYLLLRKWKQVPKIGGDLAKDSQMYLLIAVVFHFMLTTVFYSNFTYDHACAINVDCMTAGNYADSDVDNCYIRDHDKLFASYKGTDLYKAHGDDALKYAKATLYDETSGGLYAKEMFKDTYTAIGQTRLDFYTNTTKTDGFVDQLVLDIYGAPTGSPTAAPTAVGFTTAPTPPPTTLSPTALSPTVAPTVYVAPTSAPTLNGAPLPKTWNDASIDNSMSNHMWAYTTPNGDTVNAAWVWCDKRASDEAYEYFYGDIPGWMSEDQETIKDIYRHITTFGVLVVLAVILGMKFYNMVMRLTVGSYTPTGDTQGKDFVGEDDIQAYIPEYQQPGYPQPFTACDMVAGTVNPDYLAFETFDYDEQALCINNAECHYPEIVNLNKQRSESGRPIFSPIKMYVNEIIASGQRSSDIEISGPIGLDGIVMELDGISGAEGAV